MLEDGRCRLAFGDMRAAAIQLEPAIADVAANLDACERLADRAAADGAELIALPE